MLKLEKCFSLHQTNKDNKRPQEITEKFCWFESYFHYLKEFFSCSELFIARPQLGTCLQRIAGRQRSLHIQMRWHSFGVPPKRSAREISVVSICRLPNFSSLFVRPPNKSVRVQISRVFFQLFNFTTFNKPTSKCISAELSCLSSLRFSWSTWPKVLKSKNFVISPKWRRLQLSFVLHSTTDHSTTVQPVEAPKAPSSMTRLNSGGVDIGDLPSANNTAPPANTASPALPAPPANTVAPPSKKIDPKPTPGPNSSNSGVNLLTQPITIVVCFLVAMALKHWSALASTHVSFFYKFAIVASCKF